MRRACQRRGEHRRDVRSPTTDHRLQHAARTCRAQRRKQPVRSDQAHNRI